MAIDWGGGGEEIIKNMNWNLLFQKWFSGRPWGWRCRSWLKLMASLVELKRLRPTGCAFLKQLTPSSPRSNIHNNPMMADVGKRYSTDSFTENPTSQVIQDAIELICYVSLSLCTLMHAECSVNGTERIVAAEVALVNYQTGIADFPIRLADYR